MVRSPGRAPRKRAEVTLRQAQESLSRRWPGRDASVAAQVAYHERAAALYEHVARVDPGHHHEALYWAGFEREQVEALRSAAGAGRDEKGEAS
jgi:hypothetical protein